MNIPVDYVDEHIGDDQRSKEYDEALDEAVSDFMSECKFDIVAHRGEDEIELTEENFGKLTMNILANDPWFKDKVEEYILKEKPELLDEYITGKRECAEQLRAENMAEMEALDN